MNFLVFSLFVDSECSVIALHQHDRSAVSALPSSIRPCSVVWLCAPVGIWSRMLHDLFAALLGYAGDVIIETSEFEIQFQSQIPFQSQTHLQSNSEQEAHPSSTQHHRKNRRFILNPALENIDTPERLLIDQLAAIGAKFADIRTSIQTQQQQQQHRYAEAVDDGCRAVLNQYTQCVLQCEQQAMEDRKNYPITKIRATLQHYEHLFDHMQRNLIHRKDVHGTTLVTLVHTLEKQSAIPYIKEAMQTVMKQVVKVMKRDIVQYVLLARIQDSRKEFFIEQNDNTLKVDQIPSTITLATARQLVFIGAALQALRDAERHNTASGVQIATELYPECVAFAEQLDDENGDIGMATEQLRNAVSRRLWTLVVVQHQLKKHLRAVKDYFLLQKGEVFQVFFEHFRKLLANPPTARAEKDILNGPWSAAASRCGLENDEYFKRIRFRIDPANLSYGVLTNDHVVSSESANGFVLHGNFVADHQCISLKPNSSFASSQAFHSIRQYIQNGFQSSFAFRATLNHDSQQFASRGFSFCIQNQTLPIPTTISIHSASGAVFREFTNAISVEFVCRNTGSSIVENIQVYHSTLSEQILLGTHRLDDIRIFDGSVHQVACGYHVQKSELSIAVDGKTILTINCKLRVLLRLDAGRGWLGFIAAACNVDLLNWSFKEADPAYSAMSKYVNSGWKNIRLEYAVKSPIDLVLTRVAFDHYNALFRLLLDISRANFELQKSWATIMTDRQQKVSRLALNLRSQQQFLLDGLMYHMQVDVINVLFMQLLSDIDESKDFEAIRVAHDNFLAKLSNQFFLKDRLVYSAITEVLGTCIALSTLVDNNMFTANDIERIERDFRQHACFLFTVLVRQALSIDQSNLAKLVVRLDFNGHYTEMANGLGMLTETTAATLAGSESNAAALMGKGNVSAKSASLPKSYTALLSATSSAHDAIINPSTFTSLSSKELPSTAASSSAFASLFKPHTINNSPTTLINNGFVPASASVSVLSGNSGASSSTHDSDGHVSRVAALKAITARFINQA